MKILFAAPENAWGGFLWLIRAEMPEQDFIATGRYQVDSLKGVDVLIPTMSQITETLLAGSDRLKLIQQCGSGLEGVDIEAARRHGVPVANVPTDISGNADSVAELGIYMMTGLARNFRGMARSFAERRIGEPRGMSLKGKTFGIVGLGGIGRALIQRLKGFEVRIIGIKQQDPQKAQAKLGIEWVGGPGELKHLLGQSDFVVLCLPVTGKSRNLFNEETFAAMKKGSCLINLSRGGLIDRSALEKALATGQIAGAGLDVYWEEPVDPADPLFKHNVFTTPHIGGSTDISMKGITKVVAENIRRIEKGLAPHHTK